MDELVGDVEGEVAAVLCGDRGEREMTPAVPPAQVATLGGAAGAVVRNGAPPLGQLALPMPTIAIIRCWIAAMH